MVLEAGVLQKAGWQSSWAGWCFQQVKGFSCQLLKDEEWFLEAEKIFKSCSFKKKKKKTAATQVLPFENLGGNPLRNISELRQTSSQAALYSQQPSAASRPLRAAGAFPSPLAQLQGLFLAGGGRSPAGRGPPSLPPRPPAGAGAARPRSARRRPVA